MALNPQAEVTNVLHSLLAQPPKQGPSDARNRPGGRTPVPARTVVPSGEPKNQPPFTRPAKPSTGSVAAVTKALKTAPKPAPKKMSPAQQAVHDSLAPLYAQQAQEAAAQNDAIRNFSLAAMQQLSGLAPQIQHDYETQLAQQQGLMGGALASIQGANPNQQTQDLLKAIGAPQSQQDAVAQGNSNAFNLAGAVGNYVDSLPLGSLRAQGLASTTLARLQPSIQALRAQQALAGALLSQKDAKAKIDAMAPDLLAKYQAAEATAANNRATQAARQQQLALEYKALGLKSQNQAFSQGATTARLNQSAARIRNQQNQWLVSQKTKIDEFNAKQATANNKLALPNNSLSRTKGYLVDSRGNAILVNGKKQILPGFKANGKGQVVKAASAGKGRAPSRLSAYQIQKYRGTAATIADRGKNGYTDVKGSYGPANKAYPPVSPYQTWLHMREAGVPVAIAINAINRAYGTHFNPNGNLP